MGRQEIGVTCRAPDCARLEAEAPAPGGSHTTGMQDLSALPLMDLITISRAWDTLLIWNTA
jgi:hypothetical protein